MVLRIHLLYGWIDKTRLNKITVFSSYLACLESVWVLSSLNRISFSDANTEHKQCIAKSCEVRQYCPLRDSTLPDSLQCSLTKISKKFAFAIATTKNDYCV